MVRICLRFFFTTKKISFACFFSFSMNINDQESCGPELPREDSSGQHHPDPGAKDDKAKPLCMAQQTSLVQGTYSRLSI